VSTARLVARARTTNENDMRTALRAAAATVLASLVTPAFAARPFNTDDARIVDPGGWQIETYVKDQRGIKETEYWFLPGHNFGGALDRFEFTLGGNVIQSDPNGNSNLIVGQVKTLLKPLETNGVGFALSVGVSRVKPGAAQEVIVTPFDITTVSGQTSTKVHYDPYVNGISSVSVLDDAVVMHFNLGATRNTSDNTTIGSWGVGAEIRLTERVFGIAETYGVSHQKPAYQVGVRYWIIPSNLQIDGTFGWQHASPENLQWISIGLRILW
jgi:hypothetical protein